MKICTHQSVFTYLLRALLDVFLFSMKISTQSVFTYLLRALLDVPGPLSAFPALSATLVPARKRALAGRGTAPRVGVLAALHGCLVTAHGHRLLHWELALVAELVALLGARVLLFADLPLTFLQTPVQEPRRITYKAGGLCMIIRQGWLCLRDVLI